MVDNVRLPDDIERGAMGGPGFKTTIITLSNGAEQRNQEWNKARGSWDVGYGIKDRADLMEVVNFFHGRRGRARGFRFKDWLDFSAVGQTVGTTINPLVFTLQKTYADTVNPYVRPIVLPVADTVKVYVDNIEVMSGWTLGANGVITFTEDPGEDVKASFEFDVPARFDIDQLPVTLNTYLNGQITGISVVELRA
jgi:uncharacterized protein (TIGR02217 family)